MLEKYERHIQKLEKFLVSRVIKHGTTIEQQKQNHNELSLLFGPIEVNMHVELLQHNGFFEAHKQLFILNVLILMVTIPLSIFDTKTKHIPCCFILATSMLV